MKILYIEDDMPSQRLVVRIMAQRNYSVLCESSATQGLKTAGSNPDIDLVLLDMALPDMQNVTILAETVAKIRELLSKDVPILAITAYHYTMPDVIAAGCNDLISKPVTSTELLSRIGAYLGQ